MQLRTYCLLDFADPRRVDRAAGKALAAARRLGDQHAQTAAAGNAEFFGLHQKRCARRIVDKVKYALALRKPAQIHGGFAVVRIHAQRRGVDNDLRVGVAVKILIVVLAAARNNGNALRAHRMQYRADRNTGAAAPKHDGAAPRHPDAAAVDKAGKTKIIGIVPVQPAVRQMHQRVDAAKLPRLRRKHIAVWDNGLFIGDRHIEPVPFRTAQKQVQLLRRTLIKAIGIVGELRMDHGRIAVFELFSQQTAPKHHITSL